MSDSSTSSTKIGPKFTVYSAARYTVHSHAKSSISMHILPQVAPLPSAIRVDAGDRAEAAPAGAEAALSSSVALSWWACCSAGGGDSAAPRTPTSSVLRLRWSAAAGRPSAGELGPAGPSQGQKSTLVRCGHQHEWCAACCSHALRRPIVRVCVAVQVEQDREERQGGHGGSCGSVGRAGWVRGPGSRRYGVEKVRLCGARGACPGWQGQRSRQR